MLTERYIRIFNRCYFQFLSQINSNIPLLHPFPVLSTSQRTLTTITQTSAQPSKVRSTMPNSPGGICQAVTSPCHAACTNYLSALPHAWTFSPTSLVDLQSHLNTLPPRPITKLRTATPPHTPNPLNLTDYSGRPRLPGKSHTDHQPICKRT